jgi:exonuclease III
MAKFLKLAVWNANGLIQHRDELKMFLYIHDIDVMLISETHFTEKSYIRIPQYTIILTIQQEPFGAELP